jgi:hypothetical protein
MLFDRQRRIPVLRERAAAYVRVALDNVTREYPNMPYFVATGPGPYPDISAEPWPGFVGGTHASRYRYRPR